MVVCWYRVVMQWPCVAYETLDWVGAEGGFAGRVAKRMPRTYQSAVVPAISEEAVTLTNGTAAIVEEATVAAVRFDATEAHRVLPFTPLLLRSESVASSRIEQLTASARKVLEAETTGHGTGNAALIAANTRLMQQAIARGGATIDGILDMHRVLLEESAPDIAGELRTQAVWIGGGDFHPDGALFVPPQATHVAALLEDLQRFMQRTDIPALAQAALAHAQFETIHPFADGNGRTGRALIHVLLRNRGLTSSVALPISAGLLHNVDGYFQALTSYRAGDIEPIITLFARAAIDGAERGSWLAGELLQVRTAWGEELTARIDALAWPLLNLLIQRPVLTTNAVAAEFDVSAETARNALDRLEADGIVVSAQLDKRQRAWRSPEVLHLLDQFAERTGRRH